MSKTSRWKGAEYYFAKLYQKFNIPAKRKSRSGNFSESTWDVDIETLPGEFVLVSDSKYRSAQPWRHHGTFQEIQAKYCPDKNYIPIMLTKNYEEDGGYITIKDKFFAMLLAYWLGTASKQELLEIYFGKKKCH